MRQTVAVGVIKSVVKIDKATKVTKAGMKASKKWNGWVHFELAVRYGVGMGWELQELNEVEIDG